MYMSHIYGFDYLVSAVCSKNHEFKEFLTRPVLHFAADHALSSSAQNAVS